MSQVYIHQIDAVSFVLKNITITITTNKILLNITIIFNRLEMFTTFAELTV